MKKILGLGNALVDALIQIDNDNIFNELSLCKEGMTLIKESTHKKIANRLKSLSFKRSNGGSAGNALSCIAALGGDASFVGRIGADENGAFYEAESKQRGVKFIPLRDPSRRFAHLCHLSRRSCPARGQTSRRCNAPRRGLRFY